MSSQRWSLQRWHIAAALLFFMVLTRTGHFGSAISLPDASLAIFLFGGLWLGGAGYFAACMACAFGVDVFLAKSAAEAGWCLTPAYLGLIPAYAVMWMAGRWLGRHAADLPALRFSMIGVAAVAAAFLISNATFWAFSGYFGEMAMADYAQAVARYFPSYLGGAVLYLAIGWLVQRGLAARGHVTAA